MECVACGEAAISERPDRTAQGYRRFRCRDCGKQFNGRWCYLYRAIELDVSFIGVPRAADPAATTPAAAKIVDQQRRKFRLPIPNRLVGKFDTAEKEHLRQIA
jgi:hypothetical protein